MSKTTQRSFLPLSALLVVPLVACGGGGDDPPAKIESLPTYSIGGTASGVSAGGTVLRLNGANDLALAADGAFTFAVELEDGASYDVTMAASPLGATCELSQASGTIAGADVTDIVVACTETSFTVGGTVAGLTGTGLVLQLNGADELALDADGPFVFPTALADGASYAVTVFVQPDGGTCEVAGGEGTIDGADVTGVAVTCTQQLSTLMAADGSNPSIYSRLDPETGAATPLSSNIDYDKVAGLAYDPTSHRLFGADVATNTLLSIDPLTGVATPVGAPGALGPDPVNGLAFDTTSGALLGVTSPLTTLTGQLIEIDTASGVPAPIGVGFPIGETRCLGLAYNGTLNVLYTSTADGRLIEVNPATGASRGEVTLPADSPVQGLAYDPGSDRLFGMLSKQRLIRIDPLTGQATFVGLVHGYFGVEGLAWADELGALLGTSTRPLGTSFLVDINANNARGMTVGSTGFHITGLADDPVTGRTYGITANAQFLRIDTGTGDATFLARVNTPLLQKTRSLAFNPGTGTLFTYAIDPVQGGDDSLIEFNHLGFLLQDHGPTSTMGGDFEALTAAPGGSTMYGILDRGLGSPGLLYRVEPNGAVTLLYALGDYDQLRSLAFDMQSTSTLYTIDNLTERLVRIELSSGATTDVGPTVDARGMAWVER